MRYVFDLFHFSKNPELMGYAAGFVPVDFSWITYSLGQLLFFVAIASIIKRGKRK